MGSHSRLSPSGAPKYLRCHGAPSAEEGLPDTTSFYADEGTVLHHIAEVCIDQDIDPVTFLGKHFIVDEGETKEVPSTRYVKDDQHLIKIDQPMVDCMYADLKETKVLAEDGELYLETRVDLSHVLGPGEAGTCDQLIYTWDGVVRVRDWKFGIGEIVDAEENEQLMLYGIGALKKHFPDLLEPGKEDTVVFIDILQPRVKGGGSSWKTSVGYLLEFAREVREVHLPDINSDDPTFTPSPKACRWCKARIGWPEKGIAPCPAYKEFQLNLARKMLPPLDEFMELGIRDNRFLEDVSKRDIEELLFIYEHTAFFKKFLDETHAAIFTYLRSGVKEVPGKKLVEGKKQKRQFREDDTHEVLEIAETLGGKDLAYETKPRSPTQINDLIGDEIFDLLFSGYVVQKTGKAVIVDQSNPKPALLSDRQLLAECDKSE